MTVAITLALLLALLAIGIPVAFTLAIAGAAGLLVTGGPTLLHGILESAPLSTLDSFEFITIPMFILMAQLLTISGIADNLFDAAAVWLGRTKGGLAIATAITGAAFGAISGSSTASAATLSSTSIPAMMQQGYERKFASGVVAISGTLAMLIPPSIAIVFYGLLSGASIAKLLVAGVMPGLVVTLAIILTVKYLVFREPALAPSKQSYTWTQKIESLKVIGPFAVIFTFVTGSIYLGIATPVEASVLGAFSSLVYAMILRRLTLKNFYEAAVSTARTTAMIALVLICAQIFSYFLTLTQSTQALIQLVGDSGLDSWLILLIIIVIYLALGCLLDLISTLILTVPVVLPIIVALGYDPIWFGIVVIVTAEVGMVTPPVGLNVFVVSKYTGIPVTDVFRGVGPHFIAHLAVIALLCFFPGIVMWLPELMG
ncbi:TRAP transporter large permease [Pollutimonas bauzanensis]|uniref:TRAP transporter large permease n=1 Tax=Pollutimonas bauzanensis TaxID=658167 RepID=UPI0033412062